MDLVLGESVDLDVSVNESSFSYPGQAPCVCDPISKIYLQVLELLVKPSANKCLLDPWSGGSLWNVPIRIWMRS